MLPLARRYGLQKINRFRVHRLWCTKKYIYRSITCDLIGILMLLSYCLLAWMLLENQLPVYETRCW